MTMAFANMPNGFVKPMTSAHTESERKVNNMADIPKEVREQHMAICRQCKEREAVRRLVDFHVDWIDCFWDCPNDYEHYKEQTERRE